MEMKKMNILDVTEGIIIHQVNCQNVLGKGIALQLSKKYPIIKHEYHKACDWYSDKNIFGAAQQVRINDDLIIVNSFIQMFYGNNKNRKYTDENVLIKNINDICKNNSNKTVYIPYLIGCGLGNGDWRTIINGIQDNDNLIICKL